VLPRREPLRAGARRLRPGAELRRRRGRARRPRAQRARGQGARAVSGRTGAVARQARRGALALPAHYPDRAGGEPVAREGVELPALAGIAPKAREPRYSFRLFSAFWPAPARSLFP